MSDHHEYSQNFTTGLEWVWGEGFMSPGGPEEVAQILEGMNIEGARVLDIGCGLGGVDLVLVETHRASHVTGIDIDPSLTAEAQQRIDRFGLGDQIDIRLVTPGRLPFEADTFDVVFSKDSLIHVKNKVEIYTEIQRVLKPDGRIAIGDWFGSSAGMTPEMKQWLDIVGLSFSLGTLGTCVDILNSLGYRNVRVRDRNTWFRQFMQQELSLLQGDSYTKLVEMVGAETAAHRLESSTLRKTVVDQGQLRPGHLQALNGKTEFS